MRRDPLRKTMRRDCFRHMKYAAFVRFFSDISALILPTVAAGLIGDMADYLLHLDRSGILRHMPWFLLALGINLLLVPLLQLAENLLLTREGLAYDGFLMERYLHLPLSEAKQHEASTIVSRLEEDSVEYYFNLIYLWTRPWVILRYGAAMLFLMISQRYPAPFAAALVCTALLPVLYANLVGKRSARLKAAQLQYRQEKREKEHTLYAARDFFRAYGLSALPVAWLDETFRTYMAKTGKEACRLDAWENVLRMLCGYGIQIVTVALGALYLSMGNMTGGGLLTAFLALPVITQSCQFAAEWVKAIQAEPELQSRLTLFYGTYEPDYPDTAPHPRGLSVEHAVFSYARGEKPVLDDRSVRIEENERLWIRGGNGSGKSTLLNLLCGLWQLDQGRICDTDGDNLSVSELRRLTSFQEQDGAIFSGTVEENLFADGASRRQKAALLERLGFQKPLDAPVLAQGGNLSPGERKKLLLARALLKDSAYLVLDEPQNHLDAEGRRALREILQNRAGAVIFVSHDPLMEELPRVYDMADCSFDLAQVDSKQRDKMLTALK